MSSKYLITGINGFVGRYFVEYLDEKESDAKIYGIDIAKNCDMDIQYKSLNLMDAESINKVIKSYKPDYIIHLAAMSSVAQSWEEPLNCFVNNMSAFLNLADSVRKNNLKTRILSVGSSEEYGTYNEPLKESLGLHPKNPYSVARVSQEYMSKLYVDKFGLDIVMTRSFNHIGPRQNPKFVIPSFVEQLVNIASGKSENKMMVGNIDVIRDFTDVRDVVDAYYRIIKNAPNRSVYNVCSGRGVKLRDIIDKTAKKLNIKPNIVVDPSRVRSNEVLSVIGDNSKLKKELGWKPKYKLEQTISDMVDFLKTR
ncbi:MAG: GDP-mannose 4,6-dehydratase [Alphaproteobacteria bacterium]|nr:GDP-mannose 4,6-dehydratase [Alphaproteobacteria bacterium]MBR0212119.1 GDP-mannose 4,6-dehydratase [Alphaproteobacteria bacterium]